MGFWPQCEWKKLKTHRQRKEKAESLVISSKIGTQLQTYKPSFYNFNHHQELKKKLFQGIFKLCGDKCDDNNRTGTRLTNKTIWGATLFKKTLTTMVF